MEVLCKAQDILIKACALCVQRGVDLGLILIGDGKMRKNLETLVEKTGMSRRTSFAGQLSGTDQITQALDRADLFVLPSRTEGLPRAMIEAMARGLPCIGSDVGGIPELISSDCLVPPDDAPALAAKICEVLADRPRMARMSQENIDRVADYSEDVLRGRREVFYRHLASESVKWGSAGLPPAPPKGSGANASQQDGYTANTSTKPTRRPLVLFGVNSTFALNHLLGRTLIGLVQKGFRIAAIAPNAETGFLHGAACPGILLRNVNIKREISLVADLRALFTLVMLFTRLRPAIVNLSTPKMALLGGMAAFLTRVPRRIYFLRGLRYETAKGWKRRILIACERVACACAHEVICVSPSVRQCAVHAGIVPESKTVMLGTRASDGINLERFGVGSPDESGMLLRHTLGLSDQSFVIGYVGRLTRDKGIEELVQASMDLADEGRDIRLLMIGAFESGDPVDPECARLISTNALIHATGYIDDPRPYYSAMDLFAFPSHREGLGNVLLEAGAAGKPTVATRVT
jgi:glycosyltransferase involved in cell wall biosynthesis